jgi:hypothetical protein
MMRETEPPEPKHVSKRTVLIVFGCVCLAWIGICVSVQAWELVLALPLGILGCAIILILCRVLWELIAIPILALPLILRRRTKKPQELANNTSELTSGGRADAPPGGSST